MTVHSIIWMLGGNSTVIWNIQMPLCSAGVILLSYVIPYRREKLSKMLNASISATDNLLEMPFPLHPGEHLELGAFFVFVLAYMPFHLLQVPSNGTVHLKATDWK